MEISFNNSLGGSMQGGSINASSAASFAPRPSSEKKDLVLTGLFVICGASVLITLGLFGWQYYLKSSIESKRVELEAFQGRIKDVPLKEIRSLSARIKFANVVVKDYPYVTSVFSIIEDSVENEVTYSQFDLHGDSTTGNYVLTINGVAPDYKTVAKQLDVLRGDPYTKYLRNMKMDGLHPNSKGYIEFSFKADMAIRGLTPDSLVISTAPSAETQESIATSTQPQAETPSPKVVPAQTTPNTPAP